MNCPLCGDFGAQKISVKRKPLFTYYRCSNCELIYADPKFHLENSVEKARYDFHNNDIDDPGYIKFLNQLINPLSKYLSSSMRGIDYGCGPSVVLSKLLRQSFNVKCEHYDPYYYDNKSLLNQKYDFIVSTEVIEHFNYPKQAFDLLNTLIDSGAILGVMSNFWEDLVGFNDWHYRFDDTHISFYHHKTLDYIAKAYRYEILYRDQRVCLFRKN